MGFVTGVIKGLAFFRLVGAAAQMNGDSALQDVSEFFALVRCVRIGGTACLQRQTDGLHGVFLSIGNDPLDFIQKLLILFDKIIIFSKDNLLFRRLGEKFADGGSQTLQDIDEGGDGGRGQIPFHLGDKTFGKLCAVGQFFLRKSLQDTQLLQSASDTHGSTSFLKNLKKKFSFTKMNVKLILKFIISKLQASSIIQECNLLSIGSEKEREKNVKSAKNRGRSH